MGMYGNDGDLGSRIRPSAEVYRGLWVLNRVYVFKMERESGVTWNLGLH